MRSRFEDIPEKLPWGSVSGIAWQANEVENVKRLHGELYAEKYRCKYVRRHYIPKPGSKKKRPLGIPVVRDRICEQAVLNVIQPVFEKIFHTASHGFRLGRSAHTARQAILKYLKTGYRYVVDLDIRSFFDEVDHNILIRLVREIVNDRRVLGLIRRWLAAGIMEEGKIKYMISGTLQGGLCKALHNPPYAKKTVMQSNRRKPCNYRFSV
jgi:group II intron reverse transcriptase/maturase